MSARPCGSSSSSSPPLSPMSLSFTPVVLSRKGGKKVQKPLVEDLPGWRLKPPVIHPERAFCAKKQKYPRLTTHQQLYLNYTPGYVKPVLSLSGVIDSLVSTKKCFPVFSQCLSFEDIRNILCANRFFWWKRTHFLKARADISEAVIKKAQGDFEAIPPHLRTAISKVGFTIKGLELENFPVSLGNMAILVSVFSKVEWLRLDNCSLTGKKLSCLKQLPNLTALEISNNARVSSIGIQELVHCRGLKALSLQNCSKIDTVALVAISRMWRLETLDLEGCSKLEDIGVTLLCGLSNLQALSLKGCPLTDRAFTNLHYLSQLRLLCLDGCDITDTTLEPVARLSNLEFLSMANCRAITDVGIGWLKSLKYLGSVSVNSTKITNVGLLVLAGLPQLTRLSIENCDGITLDGLKAFTYYRKENFKKMEPCEVVGNELMEVVTEEFALLSVVGELCSLLS